MAASSNLAPGPSLETWLRGLKRLPYKQRSRIPITEPRLAGSNPAVSAHLHLYHISCIVGCFLKMCGGGAIVSCDFRVTHMMPRYACWTSLLKTFSYVDEMMRVNLSQSGSLPLIR